MMTLKHAMLAMAVSGLGTAGVQAQSVQAIVQKPGLTADAAKVIGDTCMAMAKRNGWHQAITILNARGEPIYFFRMDGTTDIGAETSGLKAKTAFYIRRIGRDLGHLNQGFLTQRGMLASPGGIPIMVGDDLVGAVGVGGGVSINDHSCGMAGLEAVGLAPKVVPPEALAPHE